MKNAQISINLLRSQDKDFFSRFFDWAMVGGRFIVILTESIALMMFLYRFSLDWRLVNLHDDIKITQAQLHGFLNSEAIDRDIQDRLTIAKTNSTDANNTVSIVTTIVNTGRGLITFSTLRFSEKSVKMEIASNSLNSLNKFLQALQTLPFVQAVKIETIQNHSANGSLGLTLTAILRS